MCILSIIIIIIVIILIIIILILAPVVQRVDSAIQWINHYPLDKTINFDSTYLLDNDLSGG